MSYGTRNLVAVAFYTFFRETVAYVLDLGQQKGKSEGEVPKSKTDSKDTDELLSELASSKVLSW